MCLRRTRSFCLRHREEPLRENHTGPTGEKGIGRIENLLQAGPEKSKEIIYSAEAENLVVTTGFSIVKAQRVAKQIQGSGFGRNTCPVGDSGAVLRPAAWHFRLDSKPLASLVLPKLAIVTTVPKHVRGPKIHLFVKV